jgi:pimeloyl-ACP methyl ester carboxylesterase
VFVERPDGKLFYRIIDATPSWLPDPETIVFLHGVGAGHELWAGWFPALVDRYRLVLIDTRGCGQSGDITDYAGWTLDGLSDDILAVADDAGLDRFHVVGESAGGTAVLNLSCRGLDRIKTATTLSTAHRGGQIERVRQWRSGIEERGVGWWSDEMMQHRFHPGALTEAQAEGFKSRQDASTVEALLRKGDILLETDLTPKLLGIRCPLLMILPDRSPFVTPDIGVEILGHVPSADLAIIPRSKHGIFYSHATFASHLMREFLERNGA